MRRWWSACRGVGEAVVARGGRWGRDGGLAWGSGQRLVRLTVQLCVWQAAAFIAELLAHASVEVGQRWDVHRPEGDKDMRYPKSDHRHNWR